MSRSLRRVGRKLHGVAREKINIPKRKRKLKMKPPRSVKNLSGPFGCMDGACHPMVGWPNRVGYTSVTGPERPRSP